MLKDVRDPGSHLLAQGVGRLLGRVPTRLAARELLDQCKPGIRPLALLLRQDDAVREVEIARARERR